MCGRVVRMLNICSCLGSFYEYYILPACAQISVCVCEQQLIMTSYCRSLLSCVLMCSLPKFLSPTPRPPDRNPGPLALWLDIRGLSISVSNTHKHMHTTRTQSEFGPKDQCETKDSAGGEHRQTKVVLRAKRRRCHLCPTWTHG